MKKYSPEAAGNAALIATAVIWGSSFVAVKYCLLAGLNSGTMNAIRFLAGALFFALIINKNLLRIPKDLWFKGFVAGVFLYLSFYLQTLGMMFTLTSNSAFITATNVIMVPFIMWLVFKRRPETRAFFACGLCLLGVCVLTSGQGFSLNFNLGDFLTLLCALCYAIQICYVYVAAPKSSALYFTFTQMVTMAVLGLLTVVLFERDTLALVDWAAAAWPLVFISLLPTCLCLFLQIYGQQRLAAAKAAIILSTECIFGSAMAIAFGLEPLTYAIGLGGAIVFSSVLLMEWRREWWPKKNRP